MSRFQGTRMNGLVAYVPGEQPRDMQYIKLNTNESPFPPSLSVQQAAGRESGQLRLYSDPECRGLLQAASEFYGLSPEQILMTNGSDEILNFAFMAFGDSKRPFAFPDITYGFYPVFADLNGVPRKEIALREDFTIDPAQYEHLGMNIVIANPNAPTGIALPVEDIERILQTNRDHVVVVDEAYVDFGGESCLPLIEKYDNLLVTRTFSKSFSLAGARLGFGMGCKALIADLNTVKYSTNPYNVNRMTMAAGEAALRDWPYYRDNCRVIAENREWTADRLKAMGFMLTPSAANFLFAAHPDVDGAQLYRALREKGILVRHFTLPRIENYNRITVGTRSQMESLAAALADILKEAK